MMIEIDMMGEEDESMSCDNPEAPEVFEPVDELDGWIEGECYGYRGD